MTPGLGIAQKEALVAGQSVDHRRIEYSNVETLAGRDLVFQIGVDLEAQIREAVRKFYHGQILDIKYYVQKRDDGTDLVYFEILD